MLRAFPIPLKISSIYDLAEAYQQLSLDAKSKEYTVINTHKGLFRYTRLPYGISSTPGIFQRLVAGHSRFTGDILISGPTEERGSPRAAGGGFEMSQLSWFMGSVEEVQVSVA